MESQHLWNNGEFTLESPTDVEEPFAEIRIITLNAALESKAIDIALANGATLTDMSDAVAKIRIGLNEAYEFIDVTETHIQVGVNVDLIDDSTITYVWDLLSRYDDLTPGTHIKLGPTVTVHAQTKSPPNKRAH